MCGIVVSVSEDVYFPSILQGLCTANAMRGLLPLPRFFATYRMEMLQDQMLKRQ